MKAITYNVPGDTSVLQLTERPIPVIGANEVLIEVTAAGINRPDILQRQGKYPAPADVVQDIPGLEVAGTITETGVSVNQWKAGDRVCALVPGGGYAAYVAADAGSCLPIPRGFSLEEAAALPEVLFTVWHNVFQRGRLQPGENALIYGGSGGIGSMAIQLVRLAGARVFTLASSSEKKKYCLELGAEKAAGYDDREIQEELSNNSIDLILDSLGGKYTEINLALLKPEGRLVYINAMEGTRPALNILKLMTKRLHITGSTLRSRTKEFKSALAKDILKNAYPLLEDKRFKSVVRYRFPVEKAFEAHALMESRNFMGKIVLYF